MKTHTIPYLYKDGDSWAAVDIYNDNDFEHTVTVEWFSHPDHLHRKTLTISIPANNSFIVEPSVFPVAENGRYVMRITGPDNLLVTHVYVGPWQMVLVPPDL